MAGGFIIIYVVGVILAAYAIGRFDMIEMAPLSLFWPIVLPFALVFGALVGIAKIGEGHS